MEFFILLISVPLFLIVVLLFALFVLSNYPRRESAKDASAAENSSGTNTGTANVAE
jgi:hypothetical protein